MITENREYSFSVEMGSKMDVSHVSLTDDLADGVLIKGSLGALRCVALLEGVVLEVRGSKGVLRLDIDCEELGAVFSKGGGS